MRKVHPSRFVARGTHNPAMRPNGILPPADPAAPRDLWSRVNLPMPRRPAPEPQPVGPIVRKRTKARAERIAHRQQLVRDAAETLAVAQDESFGARVGADGYDD